MQLNLRQAILQRVQNQSPEQLKEVVQGSVDGDEKALPGLGVLFEIIWKNSNSETQEELISTLHKQLMPAKA